MTCTCDTAEGKIYVGDRGTALLVNTCADLTGATLVELRILKPGATVAVLWPVTVSGTTMLRHVLTATDPADLTTYDVSVPGTYRGQGRVVLPTGAWRTATFTFQVYAEFE